MHLTLTPQMGLPGQPEMTIRVVGDTITLDGVAYDLSAVPEGGEGEWPDSPITGNIRREGGTLHVTVIARLGDTAASDQGGPWVIENAAGDVVIPAKRVEVAE
jgi:hypothetical protein